MIDPYNQAQHCRNEIARLRELIGEATDLYFRRPADGDLDAAMRALDHAFDDVDSIGAPF